jgi:hypothetical protein
MDFSAALDLALLDAVESAIGTAPTLVFYSGAKPTTCADADPAGPLVTITLPSDWMANASGATKAIAGSWSGAITTTGTARSFRIKQGATTHVQGSVSATGGGGDAILPQLQAGQTLTIDAWTLGYVEVVIPPPVTGAASWTQVNHTATGSVYATVPSVTTGDTWALISGEFLADDTRNATIGYHFSCASRDSTGQILYQWGFPFSTGGAPALGGATLFNQATKAWERVNGSVPLDLPPFDQNPRSDYVLPYLGAVENYGISYDADHDRMWVGNHSYGWIHIGYSGDNTPDNGDTYFSFSDNMFHMHAPNSYNTEFGREDIDAVSVQNLGFIYHKNRLWYFGRDNYGWGYRDLTTNARTSLGLLSSYGIELVNTTKYITGPTRSGLHRDQEYLWLLDSRVRLWKCDISSATGPYTWVQVPTTGTGPAYWVDGTGNLDDGISAALDESRNVLVAHVGINIMNGSVTGQQTVDKTYVLNLTTNEWRVGASRANGDVVPGYPPNNPTYVGSPRVAAASSMLYDRFSQRCMLVTTRSSPLGRVEVWAFQPQGKWTWNNLPTPANITWFDKAAQFRPGIPNGSDSKHAEISYCSDNGRLYVFNGDSAFSNTLITTSMDLATGAWRFESGFDHTKYTVDTWPYWYPNGFQDECAVMWVPSVGRFLIGFNAPLPYASPDGTIAGECTKGLWWFDPVIAASGNPDAWTRDLRLFPYYMYGANMPIADIPWEHRSPQIKWGGETYDSVRNILYKADPFNDLVVSYDIATMTRRADVSMTRVYYDNITTPPSSRYCNNGQVLIGDYIYFHYTITSNNIPLEERFARVNVLTGATERLANPPRPPTCPQWPIHNLEPRLCRSNGKVVWPVVTGPNSPVYGMLVYDPATNTWTDDTTRPAVGTLCGNSVASLPDGRIAMCGHNQDAQTHLHFYEAE